MRVLLIEDDSATAQGIELMLKSEGFNVYTTENYQRKMISTYQKIDKKFQFVPHYF